MLFAVRVVEELSKTVIVEADDWEAASAKVSDAYHAGDIILTSDDNCEVGFELSATFGDKPIAEDDERLKYFTEI